VGGGASAGAVANPAEPRPGAPEGVPGFDEVMARAGGENFPVASRLLGADLRDSLLAVYGFARLVDQVGDEVVADRLALLDWLDSQIDGIYAGDMPDHPVLRRMAVTARD
jgi:phytoene/squalene synthetase